MVDSDDFLENSNRLTILDLVQDEKQNLFILTQDNQILHIKQNQLIKIKKFNPKNLVYFDHKIPLGIFNRDVSTLNIDYYQLKDSKIVVPDIIEGYCNYELAYNLDHKTKSLPQKKKISQNILTKHYADINNNIRISQFHSIQIAYAYDHLLMIDTFTWSEKELIEKLEVSGRNIETNNIKTINESLWLCTNKGIYRLTQKNSKFEYFLDDGSISTRNIIEIGNDSLLVATNQGTFLVDLKRKNSTTKIHPLERYGIQELTKNQYLLGGFSKPLLKTSKLQLLNSESWQKISIKKKSRKPLLGLRKTQDQNLYWSLGKSPISTFNLEKKEILPVEFRDGQLDKTLYEALPSQYDESLIYLQTNEGLYAYSTKNHSITLIKGTELKNISFVLETDSLNIWVATKYDGLLKINKNLGLVDQITVDQGLSNNNVHSVYKDIHNRLWLSTDYGINIYHEESGLIEQLFEENGLIENEMNRHSYCFLKDEIVYGSINGLIKFNPNAFDFKQKNIRPEIKNIVAYSNQNERRELLKTSTKNPVTLKVKEQKVEVFIKWSDFKYNNVYRYRIIGFQDKWQFSNSNAINLEDIPFGASKVSISKKIGINNWSDETIIELYRRQPLFSNIWFYVILLLCALLAAISYLKYKESSSQRLNKKIKKEVEIKTKELKKKNNELLEVNSLNDQLFDIIGHDLRSPLFSLKDLSETIDLLIKNNAFDELKKIGKAADQNVDSLISTTDKLLCWANTRKNQIKQHDEFYIDDLIHEIVEEKSLQIDKKKLKINYASELNHPITLEKESLRIIIRNILQNSIKYSKAGQMIKIRIKPKDNVLIIKIADQGKSITPEIIRKIKSGSITKTTTGTKGEKGIGIGLKITRNLLMEMGGSLDVVKSKKNTEFKVSIPYNK